MINTKSSEQRPLSTFWPTPQDYNEAMQTPSTSFKDPELRQGECSTDTLGLPRPVSGAFASVYQMNCDNRTYAIRCFLHNVRDQSLRYKLLSQFIMSDNLDCTVHFEYQDKGIQIRGEWFPLLKMEWVKGQTLDRYIESNIENNAALTSLADSFQEMVQHLKSAGIAHGDLQHGNIMVTDAGKLRLVDYDGMFIPSMKGMKSNELGHRNYQHPNRSANDFNEDLDTFAAWSVFLSLKVTARCPELYTRLGAGNDRLLLSRKDYEDVWNSSAFAHIEALGDPELDRLCNAVRWLTTASACEKLTLGDSAPKCNSPHSLVKSQHGRTRGRASLNTDEKVDRWWNEKLKLPDEASRLSRVEPELLQPLPRKVRRDVYAGIGPFEIIIVALFALVLVSPFMFGEPLVAWGAPPLIVLVACLCMRSATKYRKLITNGLATTGLITKKEFTESIDSEGDKHREYWVYYEFPAKDPVTGALQLYYAMAECTERNHFHCVEGERVTVLYDKSAPVTSVIYRHSGYRAE